jgi:chromosome segregation ATPase
MGLQERRAENERWFQIVGDSQACSALRTQMRDELSRHHAAAAQKLLRRDLQLQRRNQRITDLKRQLSDCAARIKPLTDRVAENDKALARHAAAAEKALARHAAVAEELRGRNKEILRLRRRIAELKRTSLSHRWRALWKRKRRSAAAGKNDPAD